MSIQDADRPAAGYEGGKRAVLLHGNTLDLLGTIPRKSVPLVVTDPPYFTPPAQFVSGRSSHRRSLANLSLLEHFYRDWFAALVPVLRDDASAYIFCDAQSYPLYYAYLYGHVKSIRLLTWDRGTAQNGYTWRYQAQHILFAQMHEAPAIRTGDGDILRCRSVPVAERLHPAQKPQELLQRIITKSSQPGDLVLDCFAGSGSTAWACQATGRRFLGHELDRECWEQASARLDGAA